MKDFNEIYHIASENYSNYQKNNFDNEILLQTRVNFFRMMLLKQGSFNKEKFRVWCASHNDLESFNIGLDQIDILFQNDYLVKNENIYSFVNEERKKLLFDFQKKYIIEQTEYLNKIKYLNEEDFKTANKNINDKFLKIIQEPQKMQQFFTHASLMANNGFGSVISSFVGFSDNNINISYIKEASEWFETDIGEEISLIDDARGISILKSVAIDGKAQYIPVTYYDISQINLQKEDIEYNIIDKRVILERLLASIKNNQDLKEVIEISKYSNISANELVDENKILGIADDLADYYIFDKDEKDIFKNIFLSNIGLSYNVDVSNFTIGKFKDAFGVFNALNNKLSLNKIHFDTKIDDNFLFTLGKNSKRSAITSVAKDLTDKKEKQEYLAGTDYKNIEVFNDSKGLAKVLLENESISINENYENLFVSSKILLINSGYFQGKSYNFDSSLINEEIIDLVASSYLGEDIKDVLKKEILFNKKGLTNEFKKYKILLSGQYKDDNRRLFDGVEISGVEKDVGRGNINKDRISESGESDGLSEHFNESGISRERSLGDSEQGNSLSVDEYIIATQTYLAETTNKILSIDYDVSKDYPLKLQIKSGSMVAYASHELDANNINYKISLDDKKKLQQMIFEDDKLVDSISDSYYVSKDSDNFIWDKTKLIDSRKKIAAFIKESLQNKQNYIFDGKIIDENKLLDLAYEEFVDGAEETSDYSKSMLDSDGISAALLLFEEYSDHTVVKEKTKEDNSEENTSKFGSLNYDEKSKEAKKLGEAYPVLNSTGMYNILDKQNYIFDGKIIDENKLLDLAYKEFVDGSEETSDYSKSMLDSDGISAALLLFEEYSDHTVVKEKTKEDNSEENTSKFDSLNYDEKSKEAKKLHSRFKRTLKKLGEDYPVLNSTGMYNILDGQNEFVKVDKTWTKSLDDFIMVIDYSLFGIKDTGQSIFDFKKEIEKSDLYRKYLDTYIINEDNKNKISNLAKELELELEFKDDAYKKMFVAKIKNEDSSTNTSSHIIIKDEYGLSGALAEMQTLRDKYTLNLSETKEKVEQKLIYKTDILDDINVSYLFNKLEEENKNNILKLNIKEQKEFFKQYLIEEENKTVRDARKLNGLGTVLKEIESLLKNEVNGSLNINEQQNSDINLISDEYKNLFDNASFKDFEHTKTGKSLRVMVLDEQLEKEDFKKFIKYLKDENFGYYSKFAKGFVITDDKVLVEFDKNKKSEIIDDKTENNENLAKDRGEAYEKASDWLKRNAEFIKNKTGLDYKIDHYQTATFLTDEKEFNFSEGGRGYSLYRPINGKEYESVKERWISDDMNRKYLIERIENALKDDEYNKSISLSFNDTLNNLSTMNLKDIQDFFISDKYDKEFMKLLDISKNELDNFSGKDLQERVLEKINNSSFINEEKFRKNSRKEFDKLIGKANEIEALDELNKLKAEIKSDLDYKIILNAHDKSELDKHLLGIQKKLERVLEKEKKYSEDSNEKLTKSITVFQDEQKVGYLKHSLNNYAFEYYVGYGGNELIGLKKDSDNKSYELYPIFENLLPESDRRYKMFNPLKEDVVDILLKIKQTHGNFDFIETENENEYIKNSSNIQYDWIEVKDQILGSNEYPNVIDCDILIDDDEILNSKANGNYSSLSGYQKKVDVVFSDNKIVYNKDKATHLLKPFVSHLSEFNINDKTAGNFPYVSVLEHRDMSFFKNEFGFDVPESGLIKADKQFHYLTKRYDRFNEKKFAQFDFTQLMNMDSKNKYDATSEKLFTKINEVLKDDIFKMNALKFYFASSIIQNSDLHLKNISVMPLKDNKYRLTPFYDVISVGTYTSKNIDLALSINDKSTNQKGKFTVESFYGLADILDIDREDFKKEAKEIVEIYLAKMPVYIEKSKKLLKYDSLEYQKDFHKKENFIDKMRNAFDYRVTQLEKVGMLSSLDIDLNKTPKEIQADKVNDWINDTDKKLQKETSPEFIYEASENGDLFFQQIGSEKVLIGNHNTNEKKLFITRDTLGKDVIKTILNDIVGVETEDFENEGVSNFNKAQIKRAMKEYPDAGLSEDDSVKDAQEKIKKAIKNLNEKANKDDFKYGMKVRPFGVDTYPKNDNYINVEDEQNIDGVKYYNVLHYSAALTADEINKYELADFNSTNTKLDYSDFVTLMDNAKSKDDIKKISKDFLESYENDYLTTTQYEDLKEDSIEYYKILKEKEDVVLFTKDTIISDENRKEFWKFLEKDAKHFDVLEAGLYVSYTPAALMVDKNDIISHITLDENGKQKWEEINNDKAINLFERYYKPQLIGEWELNNKQEKQLTNDEGAKKLLDFAEKNGIQTRKSKNGIFFYYGEKVFKGNYNTKTINKSEVKDSDNVVQEQGDLVKIRNKRLEPKEESYFSFEETEVNEAIEDKLEIFNYWLENNNSNKINYYKSEKYLEFKDEILKTDVRKNLTDLNYKIINEYTSNFNGIGDGFSEYEELKELVVKQFDVLDEKQKSFEKSKRLFSEYVNKDGNYTVNELDDSFSEFWDVEKPQSMEDFKNYLESYQMFQVAKELTQNVDEIDFSNLNGTRSFNSNEDNFVIKDSEVIGGAKSRFNDYIEGIKIVRKVENDEEITKQEKITLSKMPGLGTIAPAFYRGNGEATKGWEKEALILKDTLTKDEYSRASEAVLDSYYTDADIAKAMWKGFERFGFDKGVILEPSVGVGSFFGNMPASLKPNTQLMGVELDETTSKIAKVLYPKAKIFNIGYQDFTLLNNQKPNVIIGNPPYGSHKIYDDKNEALNGKAIHNYFMGKAIDDLQVGGVMGMVVSSSFLDANDVSTRAYIGEKANLIGAIRLPKGSFGNANTEVVTDIVYFQKVKEGEDTNISHWLGMGEVNGIGINKYFEKNQENLLGNWTKESGRFGEVSTLKADKEQDTNKLLNNAIENLPVYADNKSTFKYSQYKEEANDKLMDIYYDTSLLTNLTLENGETLTTDARPYSYFINDDNIYMRLGDVNNKVVFEMVTTKTNSKGEEVELTDKELAKIKAMIEISNVGVKLRGKQLDEYSSVGELNELRKQLNEKYDNFQKVYGFLNNNTNKNLFENDVNLPFLLSLENKYNKGISKAVAKKSGGVYIPESADKADIFFKRTQVPYMAPSRAENFKDALNIALGETGDVNFNYIYNLLGGKYEIPEIVKNLSEERLIFEDDNDGWVTKEEYLSGNVKEKLKNTIKEENIVALKEVIPKDLVPTDIHVACGASWIPRDDLKDFIDTITGGNNGLNRISFNSYNSTWIIDKYLDVDTVNKNMYATKRAGVATVLNASLNNKQINIYDTIGEGKDKKRVINREETTAVAEKVDIVKEKWQDWIWEDGDRRERLTKYYNDTFNVFAKRKYDGSHLTLPGKVDDNVISLRPHQKNAVWRTLQNGINILDHTVGTGKTFTAITSVMESKRMGKVNKPLVVVPNHLVSQWSSDWMALYPNANILAPTKKDFTAKNRKVLMQKMATGNYDAIIIAHSQLSFIENDKEFEQKMIQDEIKNIQFAIDNMRNEQGKGSRTIKDLSAKRKSLEASFDRLKLRSDDNITFGEIGIDAIVLDESQEFKNLFYHTGLQNIKGMGNQKGSKKAYDLFVKTQMLLEKTGGKNLLFLSGTPISNSLVEMYSLQRYLQLDLLKDMNLDTFDNWVKQYGLVTTDFELTAAGKYKPATRLSNFTNAPELLAMYHQFADVITTEMVQDMMIEEGKELDIPLVKGGKPNLIIADKSPDQANYFGEEDSDGNYPFGCLVFRAENLSGKPEKGGDNMLKIFNDARQGSLDMRNIDGSYQDFEDSKINLAVKNIKELYDESNYVKGVQLIFCDLSTPKGKNLLKEKERINELIKMADLGDDKAIKALESVSEDDLLALNSEFSVYDDMKTKLIGMGVPENEIAFIHDANTIKQKEELFAKVNAGTVRFLFGSTSKMGAGTNVQKRLVGMHNIDVPWRPSDLTQRNGRIIRQGNLLVSLYKELQKNNNKDQKRINGLVKELNLNATDLKTFMDKMDSMPDGFEITINNYGTKDTLDSGLWQIVEKKATFLEQLKVTDDVDRVIEDVSGDVMNAAQMKAATSGNPLILEQVQNKVKITKLENLKNNFRKNLFYNEGLIKKYENFIEHFDEKIQDYDSDLALVDEYKKLLQTKEKAVEDLKKEYKSKGKPIKDIKDFSGFEITINDVVYNNREEAGIKILDEIKNLSYLKEKSIGTFIGMDLSIAYINNSFQDIILSGKNDYDISVPTNNSAGGLSIKIEHMLHQIDREKRHFISNYEEANDELPKLKSLSTVFDKEDELKLLKKRQREILNALKPKDDKKKKVDLENENTSKNDNVILNNWVDESKDLGTYDLLVKSKKRLDLSVIDRIEDYSYTDNCLVLEKDLGRKDYIEFAKIFQEFGGKWDKSMETVVLSDDGLNRMKDLLIDNNKVSEVLDENLIDLSYENANELSDMKEYGENFTSIRNKPQNAKFLKCPSDIQTIMRKIKLLSDTTENYFLLKKIISSVNPNYKNISEQSFQQLKNQVVNEVANYEYGSQYGYDKNRKDKLYSSMRKQAIDIFYNVNSNKDVIPLNKITTDNIAEYYLDMSDEQKSSKEINDLLDVEFSKRKSKIFKEFFLPSTEESRARADLELTGEKTPIKAYDGLYRETALYCFGIKDTLKPIDEYIDEIKGSKEYQSYKNKMNLIGNANELSDNLQKHNSSLEIKVTEDFKEYQVLDVETESLVITGNKDDMLKFIDEALEIKEKVKNIHNNEDKEEVSDFDLIAEIKDDDVYKQIMKDSFGGVMYNVSNKYDAQHLLDIWNKIQNKDIAGGIVIGAMNNLSHGGLKNSIDKEFNDTFGNQNKNGVVEKIK